MTVDLIESLLDAPLHEAVGAARGGPPLLIRCRRDDTIGRLCRVAETDHYLEVLSVSGAASPVLALLGTVATAGFAADSLEDLVIDPGLDNTLLLADGRETRAAEWRNIAGLFASRRAGTGMRGPTLVVRVDAENTPTGCRYIDDGSLIGPAEALLLAQREKRRPAIVTEAADYSAIEAARGDLHLLEQLLRLPESDRFNTELWCHRQPSGEQKPLLWRGREEYCPIWLAHHDAPRLAHRIWRGHVMTLFPWLEEAREQFLGRHGKRLPEGEIDRETGDRLVVEDYEWGHIARGLKQIGRNDLAGPAHTLRLARNRIAHGRPLEYREAIEMEAAFQQLIRARM